MLRKMRIACVVGAGLLMAACGGGGGGGGELDVKARVALSIENYDDISLQVAASVAGNGSVVGAFDTLAASNPGAEATPSSAFQALGTGQVEAMARLGLRQMTGRSTSLEQPAEITACPVGGTLTVSYSIASDSGQLSNGDSITMIADQCVFESGQPAVNGRMTIRVDAISYGANGVVSSAKLTLTFSDFSSDGLLLNGSTTVSVNGTKMSLTYKDFKATRNGAALSYNYTIDVDEGVSPNTVTVNGSLGIDGSSYVLSTPVTIQMGATHPIAGTLRIADGHGSRVDIVMSSAGFESRLYLPGSDTVADTRTHSWSEL